MTTPTPDTDAALRSVRTRPLFVMTLEVPQVLGLGTTPTAERRIGPVSGGRFEGERLSGIVLAGGSDWQTVRADGATTLDVRLVLQADGGDLIAMTYQGLRHGPPEVMQRIARGEEVDPLSYYFRVAPRFETASERFGWLNRVLAIGIGHRRASGPVYHVHEVL